MQTYTLEQSKKIYQDAKAKGLDGKKVIYLMAKQGTTFDGLDNNGILDYGKQNYEPKKEPIGYSDTGEDIKQTGKGIVNLAKEKIGNIKESVGAFKAGEQTFAETAGQAVGQVAGGVSGVAGEVVKGVVKTALPQEAETAVKDVVKQGVEGVIKLTNKYEDLKQSNPALAGAINFALGNTPETALSIGDLIAGYQEIKDTNPRLARNIDAALGVAELGIDIATLGGAKVATTAGKELVTEGAEIAAKQVAKVAKTAGTEAANLAKKGASIAQKKLGTPEPTLEGAVGQVIQGKSTDIAKAQKAIQSVDTKGVKTYKDLAGKLEDKKKDLINIVDSELSKDTTIYPLEQLATKATTKSGKEVATNYVEKSLKDLKEFYEVTGDNVKASEIDDLITKGSFTRKEVNDIARTYGEEFGSKAFGKTGEPLTSVNAQAFENTRKGLKNVARQGIGGKEAQLADESLSAIYNTEKLVKRNIEAVQKLQQRINERGLLEKAGHLVAKYGDILTGGTIRGLVGGLLPRGAGYKVLNALDLEEQLSKNLDIINRAITSKSDDALVKAVKSLQPTSKKAK